MAALKDRYPKLAAGLSLKGCSVHLHGAARPVDGVADAIAACGTDAVMLQHRLVTQEVLDALRALGVAIFLWTAKDRQTLESLWQRSPDGIMSDLVEEHHRLAWAGTEPLTMLRPRTTVGEADQLQRPPTCRTEAVLDSWTDAKAR